VVSSQSYTRVSFSSTYASKHEFKADRNKYSVYEKNGLSFFFFFFFLTPSYLAMSNIYNLYFAITTRILCVSSVPSYTRRS
jgi:hypothetical protein